MAAEIERKFLVVEPPPLPARGGDRIRQGYVALDGATEVRIRRGHRGATLTVKTGSGLARTEVEVPLDEQPAGELWELTGGRRVEKTRHRISLPDGLTAELDVYEGALAGLRTVEVEFVDEAAAGRFVAPAWFGEELTGHEGWSNAALALHGLPR
ncbi:MAG: CYTH domain-containing protein [Acidimicrobiales bacterium]|nr:CYTH domain-containing protein [Acidimicrobiales bacterium]